MIVRPKILYVAPFFTDKYKNSGIPAPFSAENKAAYILSLLETISPTNVEICAVTSGKSLRRVRGFHELRDGVGFWFLGHLKNRNRVDSILQQFFATCRILLHLLRRQPQNIVVYNGPFTTLAALLAARLTGAQLITQFEEAYSKDPNLPKVFRLAVRLVEGLAAKQSVACLFSAATNMYTKSCKFPIIVNGSLWTNDLTVHNPVQGSTSIQVLYLGTIDRVRGVGQLLESIIANPSSCIDQNWVIAGRIQRSFEVEFWKKVRKARSLGINLCVTEAPSNSDAEALLSQAHYGVIWQRPDHPFSRNSFPSKLFTYLNHGVMPLCNAIPSVESSAWNKFRILWDPPNIGEAIHAVDVERDLVLGRYGKTKKSENGRIIEQLRYRLNKAKQ